MGEAVLGVHAGVTLMMAGLIWFVQVVHYPMFAGVGSSSFAAYEREHQRRTTWVVGPLMVAELVTGVWVVMGRLAEPWAGWLGVALIGVVWLSTAVLQVPMHRRLEAGFDERWVRRLVRTNWVRTAAWTARGVLALWMLRG